METIKTKDGATIRIRSEDMTPEHKSAVVAPILTEVVEEKTEAEPKTKKDNTKE